MAGMADTTPLHPRSMLETTVGTPPGNTSTAAFFGRNKAVPAQLDLELEKSPTVEEEEETGDNII